jgi:hypothetical protein
MKMIKQVFPVIWVKQTAQIIIHQPEIKSLWIKKMEVWIT